VRQHRMARAGSTLARKETRVAAGRGATAGPGNPDASADQLWATLSPGRWPGGDGGRR